MTLAMFAPAVLATRPVAAQQLSVSGSPAALIIATAVAGSAPASVIDATTTYTARTPSATKQIKVQLDLNMPAFTTLTINMAAIAGATSMGTLTLTTTAQSAVTNITNTVNETAGITYAFSATPQAGVISQARTVTFTLVLFP